jgi:hypothetical protein
VPRTTLPPRLGALAFDEFHAPPPDSLPIDVAVLAPPQHLAGRPMVIGARVVADAPPDSVILWVRPVGAGWFHRFPMRRTGAYEYQASVSADTFPAGAYRYVISVRSGDSAWTFPGRVRGAPWDWDFHTDDFWRTSVVGATTPLRLLRPADDARRLAFTRIGDAGREGIYRIVSSSVSGEPALRLTLPVDAAGRSPEDYTASLVVKDLIAARADRIAGAVSLRLSLRALGPRQRLHVTLVEKDGTSWGTTLTLDSTWTERSIPLSALRVTRGVKLPLGFPGTWNYWVGPAAGRGARGDAMRIADVERLQLSLRGEPDARVRSGGYGVEVESVTLLFR